VRVKHHRIFIYCIMIVALLSGCDKEPQEIGLDLVGNNPLLVDYNDTSSVKAYSSLVDSLRTDETSLTLFASIYDATMGKTTATIYTQFALSTLGQDFGTNPVCDSMKLFLLYAGYYGDTLTPQTAKIYEVTEEMRSDTTYYAHDNLTYDPTLLADYSFVPHPTDTVWIDSVSYDAHMIVPMNNILGDKILNAPASALDNNEEFKKYVNGIRITTDPIETPDHGAILYMNFYSTLSRINIYYHNDEGDSLFYRLVLNSNANARFTNYDHYGYDDASPDFKQQVIEGDSILGKQLVYTQGMAGVRTKITFPHLQDWVENNKIAMNEAKLVFTDHDPDNVFHPASQLSLLKITEDGSLNYLQDEIEGTGYFGGFYENGKYTFRITRYIQSLLTGGETDYGLYLMIPGGAINAGRSVIEGSESPGGAIKLEMLYTRPN